MFDFAGVAAGAVGGGAKAVSDLAQGQIDKTNRIDLTRELSAIEEAKQMRAAEAAEQMRRSGARWNAGEGADLTLGFNKRAGEQANQLAVDQAAALGPVAARNAGLATAAQDEARGYDLSPGQQRFRGEKKVAENARITGAEVSQEAYREGMKGVGEKTAKVDHFTDKEWYDYSKPPKDLVSFTPEGSDKAQPVPALGRLFTSVVTELRGQPDAKPYEAADRAGAIVQALRTKAEQKVADARAADKRSTLTLDQAASSLIGEFMKTQGGGAPASQRAGISTGANPFGGDVASSGGGLDFSQLRAAPAAPAKAAEGGGLLKNFRIAPDSVQAAPDAAARVAEIERQLAADNELKSGGMGGLLGRAVRGGVLPLGPGSRRALEQERDQLQSRLR